MTTRTSLCDLGWTIGKLEVGTAEEPGDSYNPAEDQLILVQPADDSNAAISLTIISRENILRLRDFIDEVLRDGQSPELLPGD